ncbi:MAG: rod shape-determining protein RodA [Hyphomicrobium sp.]
MSEMFHIARDRSTAEKLWQVPWILLGVVALLSAVGTIALYSVAGGNTQPWAETHALRFLMAATMVLCMALVPLRIWSAIAYPAYFIALVLLVLVPVMGVQALGAKRWLSFWGFSVQPSELMKVGLVLALARYYQKLPTGELSWPRRVALPLLLIVVPVIFVLRQPDLGTAVLFTGLGLSLMFLAGVSSLYFLAGGAGLAAAMPFVWGNLHDYQRRRVEIFLDPDKDPLGSGYHITQSKIALGSGGLGGKGFMQGTQSQLDFLPEKQTDFIFTMFSEEWGFAGAICLLALYALLLSLLLAMALRAKSQFSRLLIAGSAVTIFLYIFINVAMVTGLVPVVGVPLPFVSYGGTALTTLMVGLGLAMSADVHRHEALEQAPNPIASRIKSRIGDRIQNRTWLRGEMPLDRLWRR